MDGSRCDASSRRPARGRFVLEVSQLVTLSICSPFSGRLLHMHAGNLGLRKIPLRSKGFRGITGFIAGAITLATLLRPRGAERVKYEGIPYSECAGIHNNLVGIKNLCVERHAPGLVPNSTTAVLTGGLGTVTVAVKPHGWSLV